MVFNGYHNSHDLFYREPFGAVTCGQRITFRLKTFSTVPIEACILRIWGKNGEIACPMSQAAVDNGEKMTLFEGDFEAPNSPGLIWYYFLIRVGSQTNYMAITSKGLVERVRSGRKSHLPIKFQFISL